MLEDRKGKAKRCWECNVFTCCSGFSLRRFISVWDILVFADTLVYVSDWEKDFTFIECTC